MFVRIHVIPFYLESDRSNIGVLLAHGYLASPQQIRPLAEFLHERGYSVYGLRLPAHGTSPGHLAEADWRRWLEAMQHGYSVLRRSCSQVVVGGVSLGGVLAMLLAASDNIKPQAVFAINPPMKLRDRRAMFVPTMLRWHGALGRVGLRGSNGRLIDSNTETPDLNYLHHTLHAVEQVRKASAECKRNLHKISAPLMVIQGDRDPVVVPEASADALREVSSDVHLLAMMPFDRHIIVCGEGKEMVFQSLHRFILRATAGAESRKPIYRTRLGWRHRLARTGFIRMFT
jgi:esterase/lipase